MFSDVGPNNLTFAGFNRPGSRVYGYILGMWPSGDEWNRATDVLTDEQAIVSGPVISQVIRFNGNRLRLRRSSGTSFDAWHGGLRGVTLRLDTIFQGPVTETFDVSNPVGGNFMNFIGASTDGPWASLVEGSQFMVVLWS